MNDEERERRRYALLQAAAVNLPRLVALSYGLDGKAYTSEFERTLTVAEQLLAEIEKQEKAGSK